MKATVTHRVTVKASPKQVFRYLRDPTKHPLWNPHLQSVSTSAPLKKGSAYTSVSFLLGVSVESKNIVSDYLEGKMLVVNGSEGPLDYRIEYQLVPERDATHVTCITTVSSSVRAFMYTRPVFKILAQREIRADLRSLKKVVEQKLDETFS